MMSKELTCEERIDASMKSLDEDLKTVLAAFDVSRLDPDDEDDAEILEKIESEGLTETSVYEFPLGVSFYKVVKVEISAGGPSSYLEIHVQDDDVITKVTYHFLDWFDGAVRHVDQNSFIWEFAEMVIQSYGVE